MSQAISITESRLQALRNERDAEISAKEAAESSRRVEQEKRNESARAFGRHVAEHFLTFEQISSVASIAGRAGGNMAIIHARRAFSIPTFDGREQLMLDMMGTSGPLSDSERDAFIEGVNDVYSLI